MDDLISRQAAIETLKTKVFHELSDEFYGTMQVLEELPSVFIRDVDAPTIDPVKHGKWIKDDVGVHCSECFCGWEFLTGIPVEVYEFHYCPNCGARVSDNWEEPEINPCRGCDDYDGRGDCKSHGGCGEDWS